MRILLLDPFHGAAGDMIVGSLLDLGADRLQVLDAMTSVVGDPGLRKVTRKGIGALLVDSRAPVKPRTLEEVVARVNGAEAPQDTKDMAVRIFQRMATAERRIHGVTGHFHEAGADDAVAEVVGACVALASLHVDGIDVLPVAVGSGSVQTLHGRLPVPVPAVGEIFRDAPLTMVMGGGEGELCTPTGAAILAEFSTLAPQVKGAGRVVGTGYGAGSRDDPDAPNVLRAILMETDPLPGSHDQVDILETNVDDISGEVIAYSIERLMEAGALDVSVIPLLMKKGRPGFLVRVICPSSCTEDLADLMACELGSLGIRWSPSIHRFIFHRSVEKVAVTIKGEERIIDIKCSWRNGELTSLKPEYEQCRAWALALGLPLRQVTRVISEVAWCTLSPKGKER